MSTTPLSPGVPIARAGARDGPVLVLFHGTPGSAAELQWWNAAACRHGVQLWCLQRAGLPATVQGDAYFAALAAALLAASPQPVHLAGFSLGGFVALRTALAAQQRGRAVASLHLLSAVAPLQVGDFLPHMAGQAVFRLAQDRPGVLRLASALQGWLARVGPAALVRLLFASAQASDRVLAADADFLAVVRQALLESLNAGRSGYLRDLQAYVQPWADRVGAVQAPAWVWHGSDDNWSPPGMAHWLQATLPACRGLELVPGQSHYGCLLSRLEAVCAMVAARGPDSGPGRP